MIFDLVPLSPEEEENVLDSVGYTRSRLIADLAILREWAEQQEHFPPSKLTEKDEFFLNFLIGCKGSLERSKKKMDSYYSWRRRSVIFADRDPTAKDFVDSHKNVFLAVMPKCLPAGYRLCFLTLKTPEGLHILPLVRRIVFYMEVCMRSPGISAGDCGVLDCTGFNASYLSAVNPSIMRDLLLFMQDAIPHRCVQYYFVNCSPLVETFINKMMRPFLNKKMAKRFTVTREGASFLLKQFPKDVLPSDYGGEGPSIDSIAEKLTKSINRLSQDSNDGFLSSLRELTDESKRPKDSPYSYEEDSLFGIQGTIKSLAID